MQKISIVTPVFNEREGLPEFVSEVRNALRAAPVDWELLFCVDPSTDGTEQFIRDLHAEDPRFKLVRFSRRFGQPAATMAGINLASGDAVIVIDADLQDPPSVISQMIHEWLAGSKIVLARRRTRTGEPFVKTLISKIGYGFLNRFAEVPIPRDTGDFRLMDRQVVNELVRFNESNAFLRGLVSLVGFETSTIYFDRPSRFAGETKHNKWLGSLKIGFNGVVGYSTALLNMSTVVGVFFSSLSLLIAGAYALAKIVGYDFPLGNPTIVISVLLMGGLNLLFMGILGLYISRIYEDVKARPKFIVEESLGL